VSHFKQVSLLICKTADLLARNMLRQQPNVLAAIEAGGQT